MALQTAHTRSAQEQRRLSQTHQLDKAIGADRGDLYSGILALHARAASTHCVTCFDPSCLDEADNSSNSILSGTRKSCLKYIYVQRSHIR